MAVEDIAHRIGVAAGSGIDEARRIAGARELDHLLRVELRPGFVEGNPGDDGGMVPQLGDDFTPFLIIDDLGGFGSFC